ncbi:MAG TPA: Calx-beta domain-containing protein [Tepidisphaeraceae bacterium]|jgi:hypothetical protein|nr:Calx-beta domain-containing protein [Tepidisphaeraceae bacterium]
MHRRADRRKQSVESLESRLMLSAASAHLSDGLTAAELSSLHASGKSEFIAAQVGPLGNVSNKLRELYSLNPTGVDISAQQFGTIESSDGQPGVEVHTHGKTAALASSLERLGLTVTAVNPSTHIVDGYLPVSSLVLAAKLTAVTSITAISKTIVNSVGTAPNQAQSVEDVTQAASAYGVDGTGVKIGVISDSANRYDGGIGASVASGDLPNNVTVLKDGFPGDSDEGRAMMEEIHDLAPGAKLYFYSGDGAQDAMVTAVNSLKSAGCKIIVDDLGYVDEPMFQDGVISKAINNFVAGGGSYFSAIGNDGNSGYLHTNTQYTTTNGSTFVNWADNGLASGETLGFSTDGPVDITLQWDNPYNGDTGTATADLDVFVYQGKTLVASSTDDNLASGIPEENLDTLPAGNYQMKVQLAALSPGATAPDMIKFVAAEDADGGLTSVQYTNSTGLRSSGYGHGAAQNTISVGAVEFASAPPFSSNTPIDNEVYSSTGPIVYAFDPNGNKLSTPLTLDKPDVSGVDGVNTSFFGEIASDDPTRLPQFYGTSAAAPNVAAVAALIDQEHPGATEAQILADLKASATPLNGAAAGTWNPQGGYGLVNADKALAYFAGAAVAPTVSLAPVTSPRLGSLSSEAITFSEPVAGFTTADLSLTRNGGTNLLTSAQTLTTTDQTTFTLNNLASLTSSPGTYKLTLAQSGITGSGLPLASGESVTWVQTASATTPSVSIGNASVTKPASGTTAMIFTVSLSAASTSAVTVDYRTIAGSASSGARDYVGVASGVLTIPAGKTTATIAITVNGSSVKNPPRTFTVALSSATNATIATADATGTILSGNVTRSITFPTATAFVASTKANTVLSIPLTLTSAAASNTTITYRTVAGTASSGGGDYLGIASGTLTIAAGQSSAHITLTIKPHAANTSKYFFVDLTAATNATLVNKTDKVTLT